jgi:hypothetical protein
VPCARLPGSPGRHGPEACLRRAAPGAGGPPAMRLADPGGEGPCPHPEPGSARPVSGIRAWFRYGIVRGRQAPFSGFWPQTSMAAWKV